jgi:hypothetical protein
VASTQDPIAFAKPVAVTIKAAREKLVKEANASVAKATRRAGELKGEFSFSLTLFGLVGITGKPGKDYMRDAHLLEDRIEAFDKDLHRLEGIVAKSVASVEALARTSASPAEQARVRQAAMIMLTSADRDVRHIVQVLRQIPIDLKS